MRLFGKVSSRLLNRRGVMIGTAQHFCDTLTSALEVLSEGQAS